MDEDSFAYEYLTDPNVTEKREAPGCKDLIFLNVSGCTLIHYMYKQEFNSLVKSLV